MLNIINVLTMFRHVINMTKWLLKED